jgi:hypothetical protein
LTLLLTLTVIVRAAALILRRCLQQRTGADHQDTQPGNQTVRQFHVLLLKIFNAAKRGSRHQP